MISPLIVSAIPPDSLKYLNNEMIRVDSITIRGNETTEEYIILRELTFEAGDEINKKILAFNRERIYSLGIFNSVQVNPEIEE